MFWRQPIEVFLVKLGAATHTHTHKHSPSKLAQKLQKVMVDLSRPPFQSQVNNTGLENCVIQR